MAVKRPLIRRQRVVRPGFGSAKIPGGMNVYRPPREMGGKIKAVVPRRRRLY